MVPEPRREDVDALVGPTLLEFGTSWCGFCRAAQPLIVDSLRSRGALRHLRIEDGPGRRLGRSFGVKLWPTLVVMLDGKELARVVRPRNAAELDAALSLIDSTA